MKRKTRIIATLGPASESPAVLTRLVAAGANVFRLNMSHASHPWVRTCCARIREVAAKAGTPVAILMDLQGPSIRTGDVREPIRLVRGTQVEFRNRSLRAAAELSVTTNYPGLSQDVQPGDTLVVDNGVLRFRILSTQKGRVLGQALNRGVLSSRRHINLPGVRLRFPALTAKDRVDLALGLELDVDFFALSFVRDASHLAGLRRRIRQAGSSAFVIAKIEDQEAVRNIDDLISSADIIMIARGDLGIECPLEELPIIQRRTIKQCLNIGTPVIVATHMLESMIENPVPTRAEVTDVANAVFEQADAVMLSGETSMGRFPARCVEVMDRIARRIERSGGAGYADQAVLTRQDQRTVRAAVVLADSMPDSALIVFTRRGSLARDVAHLRPRHAVIYAITPDPGAQRRLLLCRGVQPVQLPFQADPQATLNEAIIALRRTHDLKKGQPLVILSDVLATNGREVGSIVYRKA